MKPFLTVYLESRLMARLTELANWKEKPTSAVAEAPIASVAKPDGADRREVAYVHRLDHLSRQVARLERELTVSGEALALFIRFWLTTTLPLPNSAQPAAQAKGRERFESFIDTLSRRLAKGQRLLPEVSIDRSRDATTHQTTSPSAKEDQP